MHKLIVDPSWAKQIDVIRMAHSDPTNIQRSKFETYRTCRNSNQMFLVSLYASTLGSKAPLGLKIQERDFYILEIGSLKMGRYSSMLKTDPKTKDKFLVSSWRLDSAVHDLLDNKQPERNFENMTLLTFCVAESIRCGVIATGVGAAIEQSLPLNIQEWVQQVRDWGQTSNLIRGGHPIPPRLQSYASGISVLCLPEPNANEA
jgi:hypothetical protein